MRPDERFDCRPADLVKEPLEKSEVEALPFEGEGELALERVRGRMTGGKQPPPLPRDESVVLADGVKLARKGNLEPVGLDQCGVASRHPRLRQTPALKNGHGA